MKQRETVFARNAVGVAWLTPRNNSDVHVNINPIAGTIVMAEAHRVKPTPKVPQLVLNELGADAAALVAEHLANYITNTQVDKIKLQVTDGQFSRMMGEAISSIDQILIDTVSTRHDNAPAYERGNTSPVSQGIQSSTRQSLHTKITNSLEAVVYYKDGVHISHRGVSQMYLISDMVKKITHEHVAGGLLEELGHLGDFIPKVEYQTLAMKRTDKLVVISSEATIPGFPEEQLKTLLKEGNPDEQARRIADAMASMGRKDGCILVFAPNWRGRTTDDIVNSGIFSIDNLANLNGDGPPHHIPTVANSSQAQLTEARGETIGSQMSNAKPSNSNVSSKQPASQPVMAKTKEATDDPFASKPSSRCKTAAASATDRSPNARPMPRKRKNATVPMATLGHTSPKAASPEPSPIDTAQLKMITDAVMEQMVEQMADFEKKLLRNVSSQFGRLRHEMNELVHDESTKVVQAVSIQEMPQVENEVHAALERAMAQMEKRLHSRMDDTLTTAFDTVSELSQGDLRVPELLSDFQEEKPAENMLAEKPVENPIEEAVRTGELHFDETGIHELEPEMEDIETINSSEIEAVAPSIAPPLATVESSNTNVDEHKDSGTAMPTPPPTPKRKARHISGLLLTALMVGGLAAGVYWYWPTLSALFAHYQTGENQPSPKVSKEVQPLTAAEEALAKSPAEDSIGKTNVITDDDLTENEEQTAAMIAPGSVDEEQDPLGDQIKEAPTEEAAPAPSQPMHESNDGLSPPMLSSEEIQGMSSDAVLSAGRRYYQQGETGRERAGGERLNKEGRMASLKRANRYFEVLFERDVISANLWFMKARNEYYLAKLTPDDEARAGHAEKAMDAYGQFKEMSDRIPRKKAAAMKRNRKRLRQMLK